MSEAGDLILSLRRQALLRKKQHSIWFLSGRTRFKKKKKVFQAGGLGAAKVSQSDDRTGQDN